MPKHDRPEQDEGRARRIARDVTTEHRRLDALFVAARATLQSGELEDAYTAVVELGEALSAHFAREDALHYPPIVALRPETKPEVLAFAHDHDAFRLRVDEIGAHLSAGRRAPAAGALEALATAFAGHEASEEELLGRLDRAIADAR